MGLIKAIAGASVVVNANQSRKHAKRAARELRAQTEIMEREERERHAALVREATPAAGPTEWGDSRYAQTMGAATKGLEGFAERQRQRNGAQWDRILRRTPEKKLARALDQEALAEAAADMLDSKKDAFAADALQRRIDQQESGE